MAVYSVGREGLTVPASPAPIITYKSAANIVARVLEWFIGGEATSSTVNRMVVRRSSTDGTTPTAQTPAKLSSSQPAAQGTSATAFSGNPTLAAAPGLLSFALNVFGAVMRWVAAPGQENYVQGSTAGNDELGLYGPSGTGAISMHALVEEI